MPKQPDTGTLGGVVERQSRIDAAIPQTLFLETRMCAAIIADDFVAGVQVRQLRFDQCTYIAIGTVDSGMLSAAPMRIVHGPPVT